MIRSHVVMVANSDRSVLNAAAVDGHALRWTVPQDALPGDRLLFFHRGEGLIGEAVMVGPLEKAPARGEHGATAAGVVLYARAIPIDALQLRFPRWEWAVHPHEATTVPHAIVAELDRLIAHHRSTELTMPG